MCHKIEIFTPEPQVSVLVNSLLSIAACNILHYHGQKQLVTLHSLPCMRMINALCNSGKGIS